jgi:hypothetical protein
LNACKRNLIDSEVFVSLKHVQLSFTVSERATAPINEPRRDGDDAQPETTTTTKTKTDTSETIETSEAS